MFHVKNVFFLVLIQEQNSNKFLLFKSLFWNEKFSNRRSSSMPNFLLFDEIPQLLNKCTQF